MYQLGIEKSFVFQYLDDAEPGDNGVLIQKVPSGGKEPAVEIGFQPFHIIFLYVAVHGGQNVHIIVFETADFLIVAFQLRRIFHQLFLFLRLQGKRDPNEGKGRFEEDDI